MLRNYFLIAVRSLQKSGVYSFINIAGLAIGLACTMLILLWVVDEKSWDDFHVGRDRINRVYLNSVGDNGVQTQMAVTLALWDALKHERDVELVAPTNWGDTYLLTYGEKRLYKTGYYAGDEFLKIFTFPVIKGSPENQLTDPSTFVITKSTAEALFGTEEPIGKVVRINNTADATVTAVIDDVPSNSSFRFECLLPFTLYMKTEPWVKTALTEWGNNSFNLYVRFAKGADAAAIEQRVKGIIGKNDKDNANEVTFLPMERWRLFSEFKNGKSATGTIVYVRMFTIIAVFILIIACINFMNLATARSERRAREVGIRKSVGSRRKELVFQFLGETFFITLLAFCIALGLVEGSLPLYNMLVDKQLALPYAQPLFWLAAFGVVCITALVSGSYPAFYLSGFQPAAVLKGRLQVGKQGSTPRKIMVTLQFFVSIVLIIATLVIYQQLNHLRNRPTGYNLDRLVTIGATGDIPKNFDAIKQELLTSGAVGSVSKSSSPVTSIFAFSGVDWEGKRDDQRSSFAIIATGHDYTKTLGIKMLQGRDFSDDRSDSLSAILNAAAVAYMGLTDPLNQQVTFSGKKYTVIGVVDNVVMAYPHRPVDATLFIFDPSWISHLSIRLSPEKNIHDAMAQVEATFKKFNPEYPFVYTFTEDEFNQKFATVQRIGRLANLFATLAIMISCLGLFGLAAFMAEQRTKEIGIRKVLGATVSSVVVLLSKDFTRLILLAFLLAAPVAWWFMNQWLQNYDYRITMSWWIVAGAGGMALLLALVTVSYQAVKAGVANPVTALRSE